MTKKKMVFSFILVVFVMASLFGGAQKEAVTEKVEFEFIALQPEYENAQREIVAQYMRDNPHVTITTISYNEDQTHLLKARVAAGDPPACGAGSPFIDKETYMDYVDLNTIDYPYWDLMTFDVAALWQKLLGFKGYIPALRILRGPVYWSMVYHKDITDAAGVDMSNINTWAEFESAMASLKEYAEGSDSINYVFDFGGGAPWSIALLLNGLAFSLSDGSKDFIKPYLGETSFTDADGPYARALSKMKELYDTSYLPKEFWTRAWDTDYEASFIAKKSIIAYHGPWLWDKVMDADPGAQLSGFPLPANGSSNYWINPGWLNTGSVIFKAWEDKPEYPEIVKFFIWYQSPEIVKRRAELLSSVPYMDMSSAGGVDLAGGQYAEIIQPVLSGKYPGSFVNIVAPAGEVKVFKEPAAADVISGVDIMIVYKDYLTGEISLEDVLKTWQDRWEIAYPELSGK